MAATIRLLGPHDIEIFRRIRLEALRVEPDCFASSAEDWEKFTDAEWRRRLVDGSVFVGFRGDDPVGIMGLLRQRTSKMAHRATLVMVYVRLSAAAKSSHYGSSERWATGLKNK